MPAALSENKDYLLITYEPKASGDLLDFKAHIEAGIEDLAHRNLFIYLPGDREIAFEEITVLTTILDHFKGTQRRLKIIANPASREKIHNAGSTHSWDGVVFDGLLSFLRAHMNDANPMN